VTEPDRGYFSVATETKTVTVTKTITLTESQIRQAVAAYLRYHCGHSASPSAVEVGGDANGRAIAWVTVEVVAEKKDEAAAGG
jgi:hypothetical protein